MISDTPSSLVPDDGSNNWVVPFFCYYPELSDLNRKQSVCYKRIKEELDNGNYVDVGDSKSYLFLYINDALKKTKKKKDIERVIKVLELLMKLYNDDVMLLSYVEEWLADAYVIKGELVKALRIYKQTGDISAALSVNKIVNPLATFSDLLRKVLRDKYSHYSMDSVYGRYFLYKSNFTSVAHEHLDAIDRRIKTILERDNYNDEWLKRIIDNSIESIAEKEYAENDVDYPLFKGTRYGYQLNKLNTQVQFKSWSIPSVSLEEIELVGKKVCREAENILREEMGIPKVGEGWVSETELYYKVKEFLKNYEVIHHYSDDWLEGQHLDIYIPELRVGIEYQGEQHFRPIEIFGGYEGFIKTQQRDAAKKIKCQKAKVVLIEVLPNYDFESVKYEISKHIPVS